MQKKERGENHSQLISQPIEIQMPAYASVGCSCFAIFVSGWQQTDLTLQRIVIQTVFLSQHRDDLCTGLIS